MSSTAVSSSWIPSVPTFESSQNVEVTDPSLNQHKAFCIDAAMPPGHSSWNDRKLTQGELADVILALDYEEREDLKRAFNDSHPDTWEHYFQVLITYPDKQTSKVSSPFWMASH